MDRQERSPLPLDVRVETGGTAISTAKGFNENGEVYMNCTPFVGEYELLSNKWGVLASILSDFLGTLYIFSEDSAGMLW